MNSPIENLIQQMSLKRPTDELDRRIAELIVERRLEMYEERRRTRKFRWARMASTAATFLLLGLVVGFLIADRDSRVSRDEPRHAEAVGVSNERNQGDRLSMDDPDPNRATSDAVNASADQSKPRTRIVNEGLVRTEDGQIKRAYRTLTPKQYLLFDKEKKSFYNVEIDIPRVVVTPRPEI